MLRQFETKILQTCLKLNSGSPGLCLIQDLGSPGLILSTRFKFSRSGLKYRIHFLQVLVYSYSRGLAIHEAFTESDTRFTMVP